MSGKVFVLAAVAACVLLAGFAALRQSQTTRRIRELWGAEGASVIQNADEVTWFRPIAGGEHEPVCISGAAGLVHLRATLVDDVYLAPASESDETWPADIALVHQIVFTDAPKRVQVEVDVASGKIHCEATEQTATLIPASRDAVREYLEKLGNEYQLLAEGELEAN